MAQLDNTELLIALNGEIHYLTSDSLEVYNTNGEDLSITGILQSGSSDLSEPSVDKLLNYIDVDYKGQCTIFFSFKNLDDESFSTTNIVLPYKADRGTVWIYIPLAQRKAFQKMEYWIVEPVHGTIVYGLEIDFSILNRRRFN